MQVVEKEHLSGILYQSRLELLQQSKKTKVYKSFISLHAMYSKIINLQEKKFVVLKSQCMYHREIGYNGNTHQMHNILFLNFYFQGIEIARLRRKMLGSTSFGDTNKTEDDVKEKDNNVEDIVVMDYAQPHRKQPIHN